MIIDDDQEVTASLCWLIEPLGYQVITYSSATSFLETLVAEQANCLILDIRMPEITGFELHEILKARGINLPIIFITGHGDISMAVHAMKEGAINFLTKPINNQALLETINKAIRQDMKRRIENENSALIMSRVNKLTPREYEVMSLIVKGRLSKLIADDLKISLSTVEFHRAKVMKKMQVKTIAELASVVTALKHQLGVFYTAPRNSPLDNYGFGILGRFPDFCAKY